MSENAERTILNQLTLSVAGFLAKTSARRGVVLEYPGQGQDCGESTPALSEKSDPASFSLKTSRICGQEDWALYSKTWPRAGMTRNGIAYQQPPLVRLTDVIGLSWLPTPRANSFKSRKPGTGGKCLREELRKLDGVNTGIENPVYVEWLMGFPPGWTDLEG